VHPRLAADIAEWLLRDGKTALKMKGIMPANPAVSMRGLRVDVERRDSTGKAR
jgi:hypothetical protein